MQAGGASSEEGGEESASLADSYHQISLQLLDLAHTLHLKAAAICQEPAADAADATDAAPVTGAVLWHSAWRPLLQCMARLCCDCRRQMRTSALNYLQRAFLIHDMQTRLTPDLWEDCFTQVPVTKALQSPVYNLVKLRSCSLSWRPCWRT